MDLFDLMTQGADPKDKALDRLQGIIDLFVSPDETVQDEALARAISLCGKEWGGYAAGIEALACRQEQAGADELSILRLREEAEDPGYLIRLSRVEAAALTQHSGERSALIALYGSVEAALAPTAIESMFITATQHLAHRALNLTHGALISNDDEGEDDPWGPLAGWELPWHPIPPDLRQAIEQACPLPTSVADARAEVLSWEQRLTERKVLTEQAEASLPTACMARLRLVSDLWRRDLPANSVDDLQVRLEFWQHRAGDDGAGYAVIAADLRRLQGACGLSGPQLSTKERARALKAANPTWSLSRIGQELGITRQAVHKHLKV